MIEASANMELYDEELGFEPAAAGVHTLAPLDVVDDPQEMIERISSVTLHHSGNGKVVSLLGGEHTVTLGTFAAMNALHEDLSVLYLDAHADFRDTYHGNPYNHACVARHMAEKCRLVQVGIRSLSSSEARTLEKKAHVVWARDIVSARTGTNDGEALIERIISHLGPTVYVSIDLDAFDPSIMPAVGTPEPGGLLWDETLRLLRSVARAKRIVGLDVVELSPVAGVVYPEFMAAKLLYKVWGYIIEAEERTAGRC
jgi:agmatinase